VAGLSPLQALLKSDENEVVGSLPPRAEFALEILGKRVISDLGVEIALPSDDSNALVARFANVHMDAARKMLALLRRVGATADSPFTTENVQTPSRIAGILQALIWSRARGHVIDSRRRRVEAMAIHLDSSNVSSLVWRIGQAEIDPPFQFYLRGPFSLFSFRVEKGARAGSLVTTDVPTKLVRIRRRLWRRIEDPSASEVAFAHPMWPELEVKVPIRDLSSGGMSIRADSEAMLLFPGLEIPTVEVVSGAHTGLVLGAQICHVGSGQNESDQDICGLCVDATLDAPWRQAVNDRFYRRTKAGSSPSDALWELYRDAGYLDIAGGHAVETSERNVSTTLRHLDAAPEIAINVSWPSRRGALGALTLVKLYQHTWFGQHMAKRKGPTPDGWPGRLVLREMHWHAYEHAQRDPAFQWLLGYVRHDAGWPKLVHVAFPRRAEATGQACVVPFRALRIPCGSDAPAFNQTEYDVRHATADDLSQLAAITQLSRPRPYVEALDLVEERLQMRPVQAVWTRAGLMRERVVLVAHDINEPAAAGVFEATTDGVHLFGLLDSARLFPLKTGGDRAFPDLLAAARPWFSERQRSAFVYLAEDEVPQSINELAFRDMGTADATFTAAALLPDLLEHMWEVTATEPLVTM